MTVAVRVTPRAVRDVVEGVDEEGVLHVRVRAAPVDGAANEALCRLLADELGLPRGAVEVVRGSTARRKVVRLRRIDERALLSRWPGLGIDGRPGG